MDWVNVLATGNPLTIIIVVILALMTGGLGASVVNGIVASKRGVKGDALAKEQNGISGLTALSNAQDKYLSRLDAEVEALKLEIQQVKVELNGEVQYSNALAAILRKNNIPVPDRPESSLGR